jgi:hypothetical protein
MSTPNLIDHVNEDTDSSPQALELASRLQYAIEELDRMAQMIRALEAPRGQDT